jgi:hypothetical protein
MRLQSLLKYGKKITALKSFVALEPYSQVFDLLRNLNMDPVS